VSIQRKKPYGKCRYLLQRYYPDYENDYTRFKSIINELVQPGHIVLDAGCGTDPVSWSYGYKSYATVIGADLRQDLASNENTTALVRGDLSRLPFDSDCFDVIIGKYVVEHLASPQVVFNEWARCLRRGGKLALMLPNRFHYVPLLASVTPHWFHLLVNRYRGNIDRDIFPTYYRANASRRLTEIAQNAGLRIVRYETWEGPPNYLIFSKLAYLIGVIFERIVNRVEALSFLRVHIFVVMEKPTV